jgi:hypothetical protein
MKKQILNLGKALNKAEQKNVLGGDKTFRNPCPCTSSYEDHGDGSCSYPANGTIFGDPFLGARCLGEIQNGQCCVN